jgi:hypothetical protein
MLASASTRAQVKNPIKLVRGTVYDAKTRQPITDGGKMWAFEERETKSVNNSKVNPGTGVFQMILDPLMGYRFRVKTPGHYITDFYVCTPDGLNYQEIDTSFYIEPIPIGATLFDGRLFEPNSAELRPNAAFRELVTMLKTNGSVVVGIAVTPDTKAAPPPPPPPPTKPVKKKGKKSKEPVAAPPPPPPVVPEMTQEERVELGKKRIAAIKEFMKTQQISLTRLEWSLADPMEIPSTAARDAYPSNIVVKIKEIRPDEDDDEDDY